MDFIRVGEALLRSSQPLLPFLAPSAHRSRTIRLASKPANAHSLPHPPRRAFTSCTAIRLQDTSTLAAQGDGGNTSPSSKGDSKPDFSALLDSVLTRDKGTPAAPTGRTSRFSSPSAQQSNSPARSEARRQQAGFGVPRDREGGAIAELMSMFDAAPNQRQSSDGMQRRSSSGLDVDAFLHPNSSGARATYGAPPPSLPEPAPMKLDSSLGRTIQVDATRNMDVARAFRTLEIQCARNSVRKDSMRQRYHERPGLKRKRLKSERWRRRFKEDFKATVAMVQKMKAQGW